MTSSGGWRERPSNVIPFGSTWPRGREVGSRRSALDAHQFITVPAVGQHDQQLVHCPAASVTASALPRRAKRPQQDHLFAYLRVHDGPAEGDSPGGVVRCR